MAGGHEVREGARDGFALCELVSPQGLAASWAPGAGMVCCSLRHEDAELLAQGGGLQAYAETGALMGIPLLHPWANRLARWGYAAGGARVEIPRGSPLVREDGQGLPIHGLMAGCPHWQVRELAAGAGAARLVAELDFAARPELLALFPFPHVLRLEIALRGTALAIATRLRATGDVPVPVAFGYHPYFRLPDVPRERWELALPVRRRMRLDRRCLPTGETEAVAIEPGPLGTRVFNDLYCELAPRPTFVLGGGGRRLEVAFGAAYPVAIAWAPAGADFVCIEPMTALTNPFEGGGALAWVPPGRELAAEFSVAVRDA